MIDQRTGQQTQRPIKPEESVWCRYEEIFTNKYTSISPRYKEYLLRFTNSEEFDTSNEPYRRVWTKPISSYASNYNLFDISLAPIEENIFNKCKSQLKVVESGFHKKPIIAQNFGPYNIDIQHAWDSGDGIGEGNGFLVDSVKNHKDWYKYIKALVKNPEKIKEIGENLHKTVLEKYHIDVLTEKRKDLYLKLVQSKQLVETI
jgi:glycosyltransferase involved in cell wall biosynthesis